MVEPIIIGGASVPMVIIQLNHPTLTTFLRRLLSPTRS